MLRAFILDHREEILARARSRVRERNAPIAVGASLSEWLSAFLDQVAIALQQGDSPEPSKQSALQATAEEHGDRLFSQGFTAAQVVHKYGDLCQVITGLAIDHKVVIRPQEFQILNLCLDDAIAGAVSAFGARRERAVEAEGTERLGMLAHEMRNELNTAMLSFTAIKRGVVAPGGSTGTMLERNLLGIQRLIDRSLADVRLEAGLYDLERIPVWELLEEVAVGASIVAESRGLGFTTKALDHDVIVLADRQILAAALANLVQNALKFTRTGTSVVVRAHLTDTRVVIEVEDECGGLPPGPASALVAAFSQHGHDRTGLGLGLAICLKAMKTMQGEIHIQDIPGKGCIFAIDLPKQPPPPTSIFKATPNATRSAGATGRGGSESRTG